MLAVHGQHPHVIIARLAHYNLASHHQNFLARYGEIFPSLDRCQRRTQSGRANNRDEYHLRIRQASDLTQSFLSRKNSRLVRQCALEGIYLRFIDETNRLRARFIRSRRELFSVAVGGQPDNFHPLRNIACHLQRTLAD